MAFNSASFFLFLPLAFVVYFACPLKPRWQNTAVILAGASFYAWWDWRVLGLFAASVVLSYFAARIQRRVVVGAAVVVLFLVLGVFKYYNFFADSLSAVLPIHISNLELVLPLGISFYTFMAVSYLLDVKWEKIAPERDFLVFASYMMFFPQIAAGPIGRASSMLPQYRVARSFDIVLAVEGARQMLWGFFKKILVADTCGVTVSTLLKQGQTSSVAVWIGMFVYTIQIYADFSGYSDMAIGCGKLFGIRLMRNFAYPYFATNLSEFWRRWHVSLTTWFRDYLYIPLGGSRCTLVRQLANTMIVFLTSGLWHGAAWNFVFWGGVHGACLDGLVLRRKFGKRPQPPFVGWAVTIMVVAFGWMLFRASGLPELSRWFCLMFIPNLNLTGAGLMTCGLQKVAIFSAVMFFLEWKSRSQEGILVPKGKVLRWIFYLSIVLLIFSFYPHAESFIYFQF